MRTNDGFGCQRFPCSDVKHECYCVPHIEVDPRKVSIILISEAAPANLEDYYYAKGEPLFARTTVQAFNDAGVQGTTIQDILDLGVYLTTAVKCGKTGYGIQSATIEECSFILEDELALFSKVKAYLLMGDVAIKAVNSIARRSGQGRVIRPVTYRSRREYYFATPSFLLSAGSPAFLSKKQAQEVSRYRRCAGTGRLGSHLVEYFQCCLIKSGQSKH
jgi:hypothetical protein